jgi:hypothetical protein
MSQAPLNCLLLLLVRASFKSTGDLPAELCLGIMHTYAESILSEPKGIAPRHKTVWYSLNFQDIGSAILTSTTASQSVHLAKLTLKRRYQ